MTARESVPATGPDDGDADLVLSGGTVLTMDPRRPRVAAVAVRAGRIVAAGEAAEVLELVGRRTERIDLGGRTLMPGLVDPHMHSALVQLADWIDISPMATPDADAVRDRLRTATPAATGWVLAQQCDPSITSGDPRLDREELRFHPRADHRHRIEHCSILHPEQIDRMAELGLSPSFLIGHLRWWGAAFRDRLLGPDRAARYDPCASALRGGLRISLHSDWSVTPLEPLRCVEDAVTRIMAENGEVLAGDERIPVEAALRAVTIDAAWQCRADEITGSIEVGKHADLVLLEDDPTRVDPTRISGIPVSQTLVAGRTVFRR